MLFQVQCFQELTPPPWLPKVFLHNHPFSWFQLLPTCYQWPRVQPPHHIAETLVQLYKPRSRLRVEPGILTCHSPYFFLLWRMSSLYNQSLKLKTYFLTLSYPYVITSIPLPRYSIYWLRNITSMENSLCSRCCPGHFCLPSAPSPLSVLRSSL